MTHSGHVKISNRWFKTRMPELVEALRASPGAEVPEQLVELDIIGPRHTVWGPFARKSNGSNVPLKRGQCLLSYGLFEEMYGWTRSRARRFIDRLLANGFLRKVRSAGNAGTVYEVTRYDEIQSSNVATFGAPTDTPSDSPGTTRAPRQSDEIEASSNPLADTPDDTTVHTEGNKPNNTSCPPLTDLPRRGDNTIIYPEAFVACMAEYPERQGGNPLREAYSEWRARQGEGWSEHQLLDAARNLNHAVLQRGTEGTRYVPMARNFFGPEERFVEYLEAPQGAGDRGAGILSGALEALAASEATW